MDSSELNRIISGLRAAGWDDKAIVDFILFVATGEEQYKPRGERTATTTSQHRSLPRRG